MDFFKAIILAHIIWAFMVFSAPVAVDLNNIDEPHLDKRTTPPHLEVFIYHLYTQQFSPISFGAAKKELYVVFDSGSATTWVPGPNSIGKAPTTSSASGFVSSIGSIFGWGSKNKRSLETIFSKRLFPLKSSSSSKSSSNSEALAQGSAGKTTASHVVATNENTQQSKKNSATATASSSGVSAFSTPSANTNELDTTKAKVAQLSKTFSVEYEGGDTALGNYVQGLMTVGTTALKNAVFGVASATTTKFGICGIGYDKGEPQPGFVSILNTQKVISKKAFSVFFNQRDVSKGHRDSTVGSILFGAVDLSKFTGTMSFVSTKIVTDTSVTPPAQHMYPYCDGIYVSSDQKIGKAPVLLDTGTTVIEIPKKYTILPYGTKNGFYLAPCNAQLPNMQFEFGNTIISVPLSKLLHNKKVATKSKDQEMCEVQIRQSEDDDLILLGGAFLQYAYIYQDYESQIVGVASAVTSIRDAEQHPALAANMVIPGTGKLTGRGK